MAFTDNNTAPELAGRDNNFSVDLFFAPKAAALTTASTSGWRRGGSTTPGSYNAAPTTSVNSAMLGTTKIKKSFHVNEQAFVISAQLNEITPFGNDLVNKTDLTNTPTYGTYLDATVDTSGGGVTTITLNSAGTIPSSEANVNMVEIVIGTGTSQYKAYRRAETIASDVLTLEHALDEAPQDGATVKDVTQIVWKRGGVTLAKRSFMGVVSGDNGDTILHYALETVMTDGSKSYADADTGKPSLTFEVVPQTETINSKKQPVLLEETMVFGA